MLGWMKHKLDEAQDCWEKYQKPQKERWYTLMAESEDELKNLLIRMKEEPEKVGLKLNIQKTEMMASGPITSWWLQGGKWEQWQILFYWPLKSLQMVTAGMKLRHLLLGRKTMTNLNSVFESRDITWPTSKVHLVKAIIFPAVMYRCESWTIKKAEHWRISTFKSWCLKRLLKVLWTVTRWPVNPKGNQPWKELCWRWSSNTLAT